MLSVARDAVRGLRTITFNISGARRRGCSFRRCRRASSDALHGLSGNGCSASTAVRPRRLRPRRASRVGRRRGDGRGPEVRFRIPPPGLASAGVRKVRALRALRALRQRAERDQRRR